MLHSFRAWAQRDPDQPLVAERGPDGSWTTLTYGQAELAARTIGQGLCERGLGPEHPLMMLSGNSIEHLVVLLGAMTAGVPAAPVSVAYSLQSRDHPRIREIAALVKPGAVFADDHARFGAALDALPDLPRLTDLWGTGTPPGAEVDAAFAALTRDTVAKVLFTSGSTGSPKGVVTTHGMLAANQQMIRQVWPFLEAERPVIVDWLPWSHTFGGNHNLGMILVAGGTLYIDAGRPVPGMFDQTLANLAEVPPTIYFNVPAGYSQLVPVLESDPAFAEHFFSRLRLMFNAAAALPDALRQRLLRVAEKTTGSVVPLTGSWGLTETAPAVTNAHFAFTDARSIGVPLPGAEVLLAPSDDAFEIRVRGPMVTPGYLNRPDLTAEAFDSEGFYRTGDAVQLADQRDLNQGLLFRGRLAEDFKLSSGTFVRVGAVRTSLLSAIPVLSDAVVAGENQDFVCALAWVNAVEATKLLGREPFAEGTLVVDDDLHAHVASALTAHASTTGSAGRVDRVLLMTEPADLDGGEITDKGYVNQRQVLQNRKDLVDLVYLDPVAAGVVTLLRTRA